MKLITHREEWYTGTRVLLLKGRNKDGVAEKRSIQRISHNSEQFYLALVELYNLSREGERIYASASTRSMSKAIRKFKERVLESDYNPEPQKFFQDLDNKWVSCLMSPEVQQDKIWLFDCDSEDELDIARLGLSKHYDRPMAPYEYATKNGTHILVQPFNRSPLDDAVKSLIQVNPLMLWGY